MPRSAFTFRPIGADANAQTELFAREKEQREIAEARERANAQRRAAMVAVTSSYSEDEKAIIRELRAEHNVTFPDVVLWAGSPYLSIRI